LEKHIEKIECPECGKRQIATVLHTSPFWSYVHNCVSCKHTIMESEWILINKEDELKQIDLKKETPELRKGVVGNSKKKPCCEGRKISKKETEDFTNACIGLLFGNSDGLQEYTDKYL